EDGIRDFHVTGVQTCALPICVARNPLRELSALATAIGTAEFWKDGALAPSAEEVESYLRTGFTADYFRDSHQLEKLESEVPLERSEERRVGKECRYGG